MKLKKIFIVTFMLITLLSTYGKTKKIDEKRFQLGLGVAVSTSNLLGLIETVRMSQAIENKTDYDYPGMSEDEIEAFNDMSDAMRQAIMVANILAGMEYAVRAKLMVHMFIAHADLIFLPFDGSYNGRFDFLLGINAGIRAPFWIQPYFTTGVNFNFSFYPDKVTDVENWKNNAGYGVVDNFVFRPGINFVAGLDIKFRKWSIGAYYKYTIKDFAEFTDWYDALVELNGDQAAGMVFGAQSRFGVAFSLYIL